MDTNSIILCHVYENEKQRQKQSWKNLLITSNPKLFLTISFQPTKLTFVGSGDSSRESLSSKSTKPTIPPETAIRLANSILKRVHQRLYRKKDSNPFNGFGCLEFQKTGQPHLHLLLTNDIDTARFMEAFKNVIKSARRHGKPFPLLDSNSLDVQSVHDAAGVSEYVTKLFNHWDSGEEMLTVSRSQII